MFLRVKNEKFKEQFYKTKLYFSTLYTLDLSGAKQKHGFYNLVLSVKPNKPDDKLVGLTGAKIQVKILGEVSVDIAELGTADADQTTAPKMNKYSIPNFRLYILLNLVYLQSVLPQQGHFRSGS